MEDLAEMTDALTGIGKVRALALLLHQKDKKWSGIVDDQLRDGTLPLLLCVEDVEALAAELSHKCQCVRQNKHWEMSTVLHRCGGLPISQVTIVIMCGDDVPISEMKTA